MKQPTRSTKDLPDQADSLWHSVIPKTFVRLGSDALCPSHQSRDSISSLSSVDFLFIWEWLLDRQIAIIFWLLLKSLQESEAD